MSYNSYYRQPPSAAAQRAKAARSLEKLKKKNPDLAPVLVSGRKLTQTWWGQAWTDNLSRYADYSNRIGRGRSYVRNGAILDLSIGPGEVSALVQGSRVKPYDVTISIKALRAEAWASLKSACAGQVDSLRDLLEGKFPASLARLFTEPGKGLFPTPTEIRFHCSCPDWASMCKHVCAVLYGVGVRLDEDPTLFFVLRQVSVDELVSQAVQQASAQLVGRSAGKSRRILDSDDLSGLFGLDLTEPEVTAPAPAVKRKRKSAKSDPPS